MYLRSTNRLVFAGLVLLGLVINSANAATVRFTATVVESFGPHSGLFSAGDDVNVSYELDDGAVDSEPSLDAGVFPDGTLSLSFDFPDPGLSFNFGSGILQTFDNTVNSDDQVSIRSSEDQGSDPLGVEVVDSLELGFGGPTSMLPSDAVPEELPFSGDVDDIVVFIGTESGFTQVTLAATRLQIVDEFVFRETRYNPPPLWLQGDRIDLSAGVIDLDTGEPAFGAQVTATNTNTGEETTLGGECDSIFDCEVFGSTTYTTARALGDWTFVATLGGDTTSKTFPALGIGPGTGPVPGVEDLEIPSNTLTPTFTWTTPASVAGGTANDGNVDRFRIRITQVNGGTIFDQRLDPETYPLASTNSFTIPSDILFPGGFVGSVMVEGFEPFVRGRTFQQFGIATGPGACGTFVTADITLDQDLICPERAFTFQGVNDVVLDCAGHSITTTSDRVIQASFVSGITIRNCTISTAHSDGRGMELTGVTNSTISGNTISTTGGNSRGISLRGDSNSNLITNNTVHTTGTNAPAIRLQASANNNIVTNNTFQADASYAMSIQSSSDNELTGNTLISPNGYLFQGRFALQNGGMSVDSEGNIYAVDNNWGSSAGDGFGIGEATALFLVDPTTGLANSVIPILQGGVDAGFGFDAIEILPNGRIMGLPGGNFGTLQLYEINPNTGEVTAIPLNLPALRGKLNGLEATSNTSLLATTNRGDLVNINLIAGDLGEEGDVTLIGNAGIGWTGLSIHPTTGSAYTSSRWRDEPSQTVHLYEINLTEGEIVEEIGDTGIRWLSDIDFAPNGTLYGNNDLVEIDILTGQGTIVGSFGADPLEPLSQNNSIEKNVMQTEQGSISFTGNILLPSVAETDVSTERVKISANEAKVDSTALPFFDEPARITLTGLSGEGELLVDENDDGTFVPCLSPQCTFVSFTNGTLTFDVAGFTTYSSTYTTGDVDGDGIPDDVDACPSDPLNDPDADSICTGEGFQEPLSGDNDNCPVTFNPDQLDSDSDGAGNSCDAFPNDPNEQRDSDGDGVGDNGDEFPKDPFETSDVDRDGLGDSLERELLTDPFDPDTDGDSPDSDGDEFPDIPDSLDNCPGVPNPLQLDSDGDSDPNGDGIIDHHADFGTREYPLGDACDPDDDNDGVPDDAPDNCPLLFNPEQIDADLDGIGLGCDTCDDPNGCVESGLFAKGGVKDKDRDGFSNSNDNCPTTSNPDQADDDNDGIGNVCDLCPADTDNDSDNDSWCAGALFADSQSGGNDNCPVDPNSGQVDTDGDGVGDACDLPTNPDGGGGTDADGDTFFSIASGGDDCNDSLASVNPGAAEIEGNGRDDDCNAATPDSPYWIQLQTDQSGDWLPQDGDTVVVTATVQGPNGPVDGAAVDFACLWTSYPGKYTTDSSTDESADGECLVVGDDALQLNIRDYAAMVTISASSTFTDGGADLIASGEQRVPFDRDNDFLPDAYEDRFGRDVHPGEDLDALTGRGVVGDGMNALAEYRGQMGFEPLHDNLLCGSHPNDPDTCPPETASGYVTPAYVPDGNYGFTRLDVDQPTLFLKYGGYDALHPFVLGKGFAAANMEVFVFDLDSGGSEPGQSNVDVVTMTNFGSPFGFESGHIVHRSAPRDFTYGTLGNCGVGDSNVYGGSCRLFMPSLDNLIADRPYRDGDPDGTGQDGKLTPLSLPNDDPLFVEDSNDNGVDDGKGRRTESSGRADGNDGVLEGDLFHAGRYDLDLSAFNVDGDADPVLIELPLVADESEIAPGFEYPKSQVYLMINTHELGHSLGASHNSVEADPMFELTTDFRRNEVFLSPSLNQFNIHNTCPAGTWCDLPSP